MNRHGSNGFKRQIKLFGCEHGGDWDLIRYLLIVGFLISVFSVHNAVSAKWQAAANAVRFIHVAHAETYTEPELAPVSERDANIAIIKKVWGKDADTGLAISKCESGYRAQATHVNDNGTIDEGLFQVNSVHGMPDMKNPTANALYALNLYRDQGTAPWSSSESCWGGSVN